MYPRGKPVFRVPSATQLNPGKFKALPVPQMPKNSLEASEENSSLWFFIYEFILFLKNTKRFFFLAALISLGFLAFARIEALAFFLMMIVTLFLKYGNWRNIYSAIGKKVLFFAGGIILIYLANIFVNKEFYIVLAKAMVKPFIETTGSLSGSNFSSIFYASHIFIIYSLFNFLLLGIIGIIYLCKQKKMGDANSFFHNCSVLCLSFSPQHFSG